MFKLYEEVNFVLHNDMLSKNNLVELNNKAEFSQNTNLYFFLQL